jgi:hypothetical protein
VANGSIKNMITMPPSVQVPLSSPLFSRDHQSHNPHLDTQAAIPYTPMPQEGTSYQTKLPIDIPPLVEMERISRFLRAVEIFVH